VEVDRQGYPRRGGRRGGDVENQDMYATFANYQIAEDTMTHTNSVFKVDHDSLHYFLFAINILTHMFDACVLIV
jgi:hypothetical protein